MSISCVIPTHNPNEEWLKQCLDSIKGFDELIIVDDGSQTPIPEATIRREENQGVCWGRNHGIEKATSEWICSFDDDNFFDPKGLALALKELPNVQADIFHFRCKYFGLDNMIFGESTVSVEGFKTRNLIPAASFFRKKVWEAVGGYTFDLCDDWQFWAKAIKHGFSFQYFPEIVYHFRLRLGSLTYRRTLPNINIIYHEINRVLS